VRALRRAKGAIRALGWALARLAGALGQILLLAAEHALRITPERR
jgi:hypothetical protein